MAQSGFLGKSPAKNAGGSDTDYVKKARIEKENIEFLIAGDLINQMTPTSFAASTSSIPFLGAFSACATSMESLALAASIINAKGANYILCAASSHNAATEKQFRYPTEYGGQKPPTSQWTVTGAGCALVAQNGTGPAVTSATIGKVADMGMTDPFNMGARWLSLLQIRLKHICGTCR